MLGHAFRNLLRHKARAYLSLFTISSAMASIILFQGYSVDLMRSLKKFGVENQFGHIQVADKKNWDPESQKLKDRLTTIKPELLNKISQLPEFVSMSPRLSLEGLLNHADSQFGARLVGYDPIQEPMIFNSVKLYGGGAFKTGEEKEILLGIGLKKRLKVKDGDTLTIVTQTVDGVVNALDVIVRGTFATSVSEIDNQIAYIPISLARRILETDQIENLIIRIKNMEDYKTTAVKIQNLLNVEQPTLALRSWKELASLYNQVEEFYDIQNFVIQLILSTLTVLAVMNTVGMTVFERTGEIGTLRALGLTRVDIIRQFLMEGVVLCGLSAVLGSIMGSLAIAALNVASLEVNLPGSSIPVPILAAYEVRAYLLAFFYAAGSTMMGSLLPAYRASQLTIVEALRKNV